MPASDWEPPHRLFAQRPRLHSSSATQTAQDSGVTTFSQSLRSGPVLKASPLVTCLREGCRSNVLRGASSTALKSRAVPSLGQR
eukprot:scaffold5150_cov376-Prasinococcus_capsulatus_cf.AAC.4